MRDDEVVPSPLARSAPRVPLRLGSVIAAVLVLAAACGGGSDDAASGADSITVASFDFSESETLGELYAQALEANGFRVNRAIGAGPRELVEPALEQGAADVVPEYLGSSIAFLGQGAGRTPSDTATALQLLTDTFAGRGVKPLQPAPAENKNVFVVTRATAERLGLAKLSDLQPVAGEMVFGGPPECPQRPLCLQGLVDTYDLHFTEIQSLDVGGRETVQALQTGAIQVGLLFTTSPLLNEHEFVQLDDDQHLQPAENVVPVVRTEVLDRHAPRLAEVIDAVSVKLDTKTLIELNEQVDVKKQPRHVVVKNWLSRHPDLRG